MSEPQESAYLLPQIVIGQEDVEPHLVLQEFLEREAVRTSISHREKTDGSSGWKNFKLKVSGKTQSRKCFSSGALSLGARQTGKSGESA